MDERENLVAEEGFDWLYGEDAAGAVVENPPAIGPVTEAGAPSAPSFEEATEATVEPSFDDTFDPLLFETTTEEAESSFESSSQEASTPVSDEVGQSFLFDDDVDLEALDASFGPPTSVEQAGPAASPVQQEEPPAPTMPPPPPPPPAPVAVEEPQVPESFMDEATTQMAAVDEPVQEEVDEQVDEPSDEQIDALAAVEEALTGQMPAVSEPTVQIPATSSRGDIIAARPRKLTLRERLTPARPAIRVKKDKGGSSESASTSKGSKVLVTVLVLTVSIAGTVWRMEGLREFIFGNGAPSEEAVAAAFTPIKSYSYTEIPAEQMATMEQMMEPIMPPEVEHWDMRVLGQQPNPAGVISIFSLDPDITTAEEWETGKKEIVVPEMGPAKYVKVKGTEAVLATPPSYQGASLMIFPDPDGMLFMVIGKTAGMTEDIGKQLAKANL